MPSQKRLKSVIQSIAHHSVSGLSFLHPHLGKACKQKGLTFIRIDMLADDPCPGVFKDNAPLKSAIVALSKKFAEILNAEGFGITDVKNAVMTFQISSWDDYRTVCDAFIVSSQNRRYEYKVDYMGTSEPLY